MGKKSLARNQQMKHKEGVARQKCEPPAGLVVGQPRIKVLGYAGPITHQLGASILTAGSSTAVGPAMRRDTWREIVLEANRDI
jgi:hypothetical protein